MISKDVFLAIFTVWFLVRMVFENGATGEPAKNSYYPQSERFMVFLNAITMMLLPLMIVFTPWLDRFAMGLPQWVRIVAAAVLVSSVWLFSWMYYCLGRFWSSVLEIRDGHKLIRTGPYAYVRHPMYLQMWIWVLFQGLLLDNWLLEVSGIAAWTLLYFVRIPREEKMMLDEFGDEYREFVKNTNRVIPRMRKPV